MSPLERSLWSGLTFALAFASISLVASDLHPHRFLFGLPFIGSLVVILGAITLLSRSGFVDFLSAMISADITRRIWQTCLGLMVLRSVFVGMFESSCPVLAEHLGSVLLCGPAAFFVLVDLTRCAKEWPRFHIPELGRLPPRRCLSTQVTDRPCDRFGAVACALAVFAVWRLASGLGRCLAGRQDADAFFISELGVGKFAGEFSSTLLTFGIFLFPLFLSFMTAFRSRLVPEAAKFCVGGWLAVAGITGIGIWDLHHPMHYLSIAAWLWPLAVILDQYVPTRRGFVDLRFPAWIVKVSMVGYVVSMLVFPRSPTARILCIWCQRIVVLTTLLWLGFLWKTIAAESLGLGDRINGPALE